MSNKNEFGNIAFDLPKNQSNVIKVIGVGGGGSNAINHMFQQGIKGVDFVICNTDSQALQSSGVPNKIQLGVHLTEGLGAGANPDVGEQSAIESLEDIRRMLDTNTKMVFITAGMGGGTGTGAAPVIAKMAKELDILTVGIVTMPFQFEGRMRNEQAQRGIETLRSHCDSLIVINNNKLREVYGNLGFKAGFSKADEVLATASRGIAEVITHHYTQNIDLRDAKTVLSNSGTAIMGSATASGKSRAQEAIMKALDSPLLNDNKITGAKNVLLLIVSGAQEITIDEIGEINDHIQNQAGHSANIIMGVGEDDTLQESIAVTIIATGFDVEQQHEISNTEIKKVIHALEDHQDNDSGIKARTPLTTPLQQAAETPKETVIVHTLEEEVPQRSNDQKPQMELIPTTEFMKNLNVIYDELLIENYKDTDDFIITPAATQAPIVEAPKESEFEEDQVTLTFDFPIPSAPVQQQAPQDQEVRYDLDEATKQIQVNDAVEVVPVAEVNSSGEKRYALEDFMDEDDEDFDFVVKPAAKKIEIVEEDVRFERRVVSSPIEPEMESEVEDIDPMNSPASAMIRGRADERRRRMKEFNYKFKNSKIDEIEKEPAYKRQGINLDERHHSSEINSSRMSVGTDDNDDLQLRSNNSFLHDNVD